MKKFLHGLLHKTGASQFCKKDFFYYSAIVPEERIDRAIVRDRTLKCKTELQAIAKTISAPTTHSQRSGQQQHFPVDAAIARVESGRVGRFGRVLSIAGAERQRALYRCRARGEVSATPEKIAVPAKNRAIAVSMPNDATVKDKGWKSFRVSVQVERETGLNFLSNVPSQVQQVIESKVDSQ